ncbi:MAG: hypothetical protein GYA66_13155 [Phyllobacteriaceae bacterium]|nr:hypothetical protein [Phyllobacteriaceae bacterium]
MIGKSGTVLLRAARLVFAFASLWLLLAVLPQTSAVSFADDTVKMCQPQPNQCGCVSCGCTPDYGRPTCPAGSRLYDDYCLPDCPGDFVRYPGIPGLCMPPCQHGCPEGYDQVPLPECPDFHVRDLRNPDRCIPDYDRLRNNDNCAEGMSYSSETGQCEFDCPDGFFRNGRGQCEFAYEGECRKGYTRNLRTGKCVPEGDWPVTYNWVCLPTCPQGTYRDIQYPTRCVPPPPVCEDGYTLENGRCMPVCEQGTVRDRYGYCVPQTCPDGTYPNLRGQCRQPDCPDGWGRNEQGNCSPPEDRCEDGTVEVRGECVPIDEGCGQDEEELNGQCVPICKQGLRRDANGRCVPERQACPKGTEAYKGRCVDICQQGTRRNADGRCVTIERKCPEGFLRTKDGKCLRQPTQVICPKGYRPDGQGGCNRIVTLIPQGCPDNTVYNKRTKKCERIRRARPQPTPDAGEDGDPDEPPPTRRVNPNIQVTPEMLERLIPQKRPRPQVNQQAECPKGTVRDNNGRCVEG